MIEFTELVNAQELDEFVKQHENCHFMQTSLWGRVKSDWSWHGIICRDADRKIQGTMALLSRKLKWTNTSILYAPRGPIYHHGDQKTLLKLLEAAKELADRLNAVLLRLDPMVCEEDRAFISWMKNEGFRCDQAADYSLYQPRMCYVLDLHEKSPKDLEISYHQSTKRHLRTAVKNGVRIKRSSDVDAFYALMRKTAQHNGFALREYHYFKRFLDQMGESARLYLAFESDRAIAGSIAVFMGDRAWYMYGASDPKNRKSHPNELLQWQMQSDAILAGCRYFDMRGVEGYPVQGNPKLGLHQFKQGFAAQFVAYAGQFDYVCKPLIYRLLKLYAKIF